MDFYSSVTSNLLSQAVEGRKRENSSRDTATSFFWGISAFSPGQRGRKLGKEGRDSRSLLIPAQAQIMTLLF